MTDKLKPCPFCGGISILNTLTSGKTVFAVCMKCGVRTLDYEYKDRAREAWNRRVDNDE